MAIRIGTRTGAIKRADQRQRGRKISMNQPIKAALLAILNKRSEFIFVPRRFLPTCEVRHAPEGAELARFPCRRRARQWPPQSEFCGRARTTPVLAGLAK